MGRSTTICAVFLAAGCGADAGQGSPWFIDEAADVRTIEQAVEAELRANPGWEHENISDHGTERTELLFAENELRAHVDDYDLFRDENPQVYRDAVGSWSVDERGVVHLEWQADGYGFVEERTWAPTSAEFAAQLRERDPHERGVWVSTGYLAQDASLTRFHHRWWKSSGYTEQGGAESTLVLSASPQELAGGAPCAFRFEMRVVAREQTGEENFEFECDVQQVDGFHRVRSIEMPEDAYPISGGRRC